MDYRRLLLALAAQLGVFAAGALAWLAFAHGLYASALLCVLAGIVLASLGLTTTAFRIGRDLLKRAAQPGAIFTAELSRRRLQVLLDQTPSPLLLQPESGQLIAVNRAARTLFDVSYALPVTARRQLLGEAEGLATLPGQIKWKGGTYAVHLAEMEEEDRSSHLAVLTDISADVRAAEATALRDLLRVLNHELMNALTPVASMSKSALDLLGDDTPESRALAVKALERVVARTENLSGFINAYRAMTRLPPPVVRPVRLDDWLDVAAESFAAQWGETVRLDHILSDPDLSAMMDEDQMWLCVGNLLNNGAQAALDNAQPPVVRLHVHIDGDGVSVHVEDSGKGIPADQADQVFLPFYTTKATGTGVGLSLARQIVQGHGSTLSLMPPAPGHAERLGGACFAFRLRQA
ncbi:MULTISPECIES: PAS domain-containing sensor histidine kinase [Asticcacaulis]|uniref:sensor histidine kinase n=1 Tax=Asticcacaulis TaxID=76890 RepID=UPI001AE497F8|nr:MULTISPECIES: ATP-binding protein [Asticcacaulis]MBP2159190.1 nitrogen fixation/metabolism regulation signal transduction histidine kinase [Asticcacaulis solisilvae]MDR6800235.1 nitrogen fixation/metabolism regulation signal transduction histidine kinase [Asticcacaulis sp. BE141]